MNPPVAGADLEDAQRPPVGPGSQGRRHQMPGDLVQMTNRGRAVVEARGQGVGLGEQQREWIGVAAQHVREVQPADAVGMQGRALGGIFQQCFPKEAVRLRFLGDVPAACPHSSEDALAYGVGEEVRQQLAVPWFDACREQVCHGEVSCVGNQFAYGCDRHVSGQPQPLRRETVVGE